MEQISSTTLMYAFQIGFFGGLGLVIPLISSIFFLSMLFGFISIPFELIIHFLKTKSYDSYIDNDDSE